MDIGHARPNSLVDTAWVSDHGQNPGVRLVEVDVDTTACDTHVVLYGDNNTWFALTELLGYQNVRTCDGSWTEWGCLIGAPIGA